MSEEQARPEAVAEALDEVKTEALTGSKAEALVEARDLSKDYTIKGQRLGLRRTVLKAVDDVSLTIYRGETLGIVGESGSGKSTLGRLLLRLLPATRGDIHYEGQPIAQLSDRHFRPYRQQMQMVFQDPFSALNPWMTVYELIAEPMVYYRTVPRDGLRSRVADLLEKVGLSAHDMGKYPHAFSGGQRQRICIARALALQPQFIVCDEPVSALDVSIQSQIINLLADLQQEFGLTYLFISHNFAVIRNIADRVAVMYRGKIVELCPVEELFARPCHPYTVALLEAVLPIDPDTRRPAAELPDERQLSPATEGCRFAGRCPSRMAHCLEQAPALAQIGEGHYVACHLH